jgi:epoxyqueuosine reductase
LEREYAHRAGLGWFGKNTMLIDSRSGSWFVIGLLLTTLDIEPDLPAQGGCGTCRACIDACPTGAIVWLEQGGRWAVDARRCISYLTIEAPAEADARIGDWTFGCDVCQEVCPFNARRGSQPLRARPTSEPDFLRHSPVPGMPLEQIERLTPEEWDAATQGSPIRRAGYDGLRRVARINRGNSDA